MAISYKFEPNAGYRYIKGDVSILMHALAAFKPEAIVTNLDLNNFFKHLNKFLQSVSDYAPEKQGFSNILTADSFPVLQIFAAVIRLITISTIHSSSDQFSSIEILKRKTAKIRWKGCRT